MAQQQAMVTLTGQVMAANDRGLQIDTGDGGGPGWYNWSRYANESARVPVPKGSRITFRVDSAGYLRNVRVDQAPVQPQAPAVQRQPAAGGLVHRDPSVERRIRRA